VRHITRRVQGGVPLFLHADGRTRKALNEGLFVMNIETALKLSETNASFVQAPIATRTAPKHNSVWSRDNGESVVVTAATVIAGLLSCAVTLAAFTEAFV
jgi:hypothetical protein